MSTSLPPRNFDKNHEILGFEIYIVYYPYCSLLIVQISYDKWTGLGRHTSTGTVEVDRI